MFSFISEIAVFVGLSGVVFLALRALPRVPDEAFTESRSRIRTHEFLLLLEKTDDILKSAFEKLLRRLKILILKMDNMVTKKIGKVTDDRTKEKTSFVIPNLPVEAGGGEEMREEVAVMITEEGKVVEETPEILEEPKRKKKVSL